MEMLRLTWTKKEPESPLDKQINAVLDDMSTKGVTSDEYPKLMSLLERLNGMKQKAKLPPVSRDTVVMVAGNFLIALLIVMYEQKHVMTTKVPIPFTRTGKT
jgi:hypothetical protein